MTHDKTTRSGSYMSAEEFADTYPNLNRVYLVTRDRMAAKYNPVTARAMVAWLNSTMYAVAELPYDQWDESLPADTAEAAHQEWLKALVDLKLVAS